MKIVIKKNLEVESHVFVLFFFSKQNILPLVLKKAHQLQNYAFRRDCTTINVWSQSIPQHLHVVWMLFFSTNIQAYECNLATRLYWWNGYQSSILKKEFPLWLSRIDLLYMYIHVKGKDGFLIKVEQTLYKIDELKLEYISLTWKNEKSTHCIMMMHKTIFWVIY